MPCGPQLIDEVEKWLLYQGCTPKELQSMIGRKVTTRSIRYAIAALIKQGRAKRKGQQGPVYAMRSVGQQKEQT
jgi:hypothetical protein